MCLFSLLSPTYGVSCQLRLALLASCCCSTGPARGVLWTVRKPLSEMACVAHRISFDDRVFWHRIVFHHPHNIVFSDDPIMGVEVTMEEAVYCCYSNVSYTLKIPACSLLYVTLSVWKCCYRLLNLLEMHRAACCGLALDLCFV